MFNILQWNMHGYYNNFHELDILIKEYAPSFISLQETNLAAGKSATAPNQYQSYFYNLPQNLTSKRGIAILIKKSTPHKQIPVSSNIATIAIEISLSFQFSIISLYIPPSQNFSCSDLINIFRTISTPFIIVGDFNAWSPLWGSATTNIRGSMIEDLVFSENLIIPNDNKPTHFSTHKTFTTVDLTICSSNIAPKLTTNTLSHLHGSDHYPILTSLSTPFTSKSPQKPRFIIGKANWDMFGTTASRLCADRPCTPNISREVATITKIIRISAHLSIPQTNPKVHKKIAPHWSSELSQLRSEKRFLWTEYKRTRSNSNLMLYKKANAIFRKKLKQSKRECLNKFSESINHQTNPKRAWSDIKRLSGTNPQSHITSINSAHGPIVDHKQIANHFAKYWSNYSHDSNFHPTFLSEKNKYLNSSSKSSPATSSITDCKINNIEFESTLSSLSGRTPGADRISYPMLQHLPPCMKTRLLMLYNNILSQGTFPQAWKHAVVVPIPKSGNPSTETSGFRPISLLNCLGKLLEKIIARRISWHAVTNNSMSPQQMAYKDGQSTIDALLLFENHASSALANRNHLSALSIDFEKAFDRVGVHVVLRQLEKWGIGCHILRLIQSFLTNRRFVCKVNNTLSDPFTLHNGIPQGSPLSVSLFIAAFNEVSHIINKYINIDHICYADDVLMAVAVNKCKNFHICRKHKCDYFTIIYNNSPFSNTNSLKF
uniref:RNA-directed DNA polymerase from mobile element jockey n=1 Tax=Bactrocera latifrons TaxID=174628 RepID=A0A0K8W3B0_BACLA